MKCAIVTDTSANLPLRMISPPEIHISLPYSAAGAVRRDHNAGYRKEVSR